MTDTAELPNGQRIRCRNDNVLVAMEPDANRTLASGIIAPGGHRPVSRAPAARVLAVGPGHYPDVRLKPSRATEPVDKSPVQGGGFVPTTVRPGQRVLLDTGLAGDTMREVDEVHYRMVRESEIVMVIDDATEVG